MRSLVLAVFVFSLLAGSAAADCGAPGCPPTVNLPLGEPPAPVLTLSLHEQSIGYDNEQPGVDWELQLGMVLFLLTADERVANHVFEIWGRGGYFWNWISKVIDPSLRPHPHGMVYVEPPELVPSRPGTGSIMDQTEHMPPLLYGYDDPADFDSVQEQDVQDVQEEHDGGTPPETGDTPGDDSQGDTAPGDDTEPKSIMDQVEAVWVWG